MSLLVHFSPGGHAVESHEDQACRTDLIDNPAEVIENYQKNIVELLLVDQVLEEHLRIGRTPVDNLVHVEVHVVKYYFFKVAHAVRVPLNQPRVEIRHAHCKYILININFSYLICKRMKELTNQS